MKNKFVAFIKKHRILLIVTLCVFVSLNVAGFVFITSYEPVLKNYSWKIYEGEVDNGSYVFTYSDINLYYLIPQEMNINEEYLAGKKKNATFFDNDSVWNVDIVNNKALIYFAKSHNRYYLSTGGKFMDKLCTSDKEAFWTVNIVKNKYSFCSQDGYYLTYRIYAQVWQVYKTHFDPGEGTKSENFFDLYVNSDLN